MAPQIFSFLPFQWYLPEIVGSGVFDIFVAKSLFFYFVKTNNFCVSGFFCHMKDLMKI